MALGPRQRAHVVCGNAGAGKSTFAARLCIEAGAVLIDIDTVTERLAQVALRGHGLSPDDRDSAAYKALLREPIYETLDGPACDSGQECIAIPGCPSAICIGIERACLETCGAPSCLLLESFPAQIACEEGKPAPGNSGSSCAELEQRRDAELAQIQACSSAAECGQVLEGTSCGCTRHLVARSDADVARFQEIQAAINGAECGGFVSTCDCPAADGFACEQGRCAWNYVDADSPAAL